MSSRRWLGYKRREAAHDGAGSRAYAGKEALCIFGPARASGVGRVPGELRPRPRHRVHGGHFLGSQCPPDAGRTNLRRYRSTLWRGRMGLDIHSQHCGSVTTACHPETVADCRKKGRTLRLPMVRSPLRLQRLGRLVDLAPQAVLQASRHAPRRLALRSHDR